MFIRSASNVAYKSSKRGYATLREIEMRLKSIKNIEKITKTMKVVASTRLSKAEKAKASAREYENADSQFYKFAEVDKTKTAESPQRDLIIAITSDKGLCGSIHSQLAKSVRVQVSSTSYPTDIITVGDKIKNQLLRSHGDNIKLSFNGVGKETPNFEESSLIANKILEQGLSKYAKISIYYNDPISSLSFKPSDKQIYKPDTIEQSSSFSKYEIDSDSNVSQDLFEFTLANTVLSAMADGYAAEVSARRNAMDNASKNAGDMINRYSILYNRTRQAVITNELVDIITGASSLD